MVGAGDSLDTTVQSILELSGRPYYCVSEHGLPYPLSGNGHRQPLLLDRSR